VTKLPRELSGLQVRNALRRAGFSVQRQKGSHVVMRRDQPFAQVVVPMHRSIDTGTLHAILEAAGLTTDEFRNFL
jgi:predicted RNA binding protein YcfA (HicA-like mRNA interferase family)